jgi:RimJ/RimL family protein N-acetyltransferase
MENLEAGHHVYTRVENGKLVQYGWLIGSQDRRAATGDERYPVIPADSVLLADFYTYLQDQSLSRSSLCQMLFDAANVFGAKQAYLCVSADNRALRQVVEEAGFTYQYGLFKKNVLWRMTNWSTACQRSSETA